MELNKKLKFLRQKQEWSQQEVADRLHISLTAYSNIERGKSDVNLTRLSEIAAIYDLTGAELLTLEM